MRANVFQRWSGTAACSVKHGIQQIQERLDELGTVLTYRISEAEEELGIFCNTLQLITVIHNNDLVRSIKCFENSYYKSIIT